MYILSFLDVYMPLRYSYPHAPALDQKSSPVIDQAGSETEYVVQYRDARLLTDYFQCPYYMCKTGIAYKNLVVDTV